MTDDPPLPVARPAERYGDRTTPGRRRAVQVIVGILAAAALTWWIVIAFGHSTPDVRWELIGFGRVTDTSLDMHFTMDRDRDVPVVCVLLARDKSATEVGQVAVTIPAADGRHVDLVRTVRTTRRPVSAEIQACGETMLLGPENRAGRDRG